MTKISLFSYAIFICLLISLTENLSFPPMSGTGVAFVSQEVTPGIEIVYQQPGDKIPEDANVVLTTDANSSEISTSEQPTTVAVETVVNESKSVTGVIPFNG